MRKILPHCTVQDCCSAVQQLRRYLLCVLLIQPVTGEAGISSSPVSLQQECVVLLHGMARTRRAMLSLQQVLTEAGYTTVNTGYPSTSKSIADIADMLPLMLESCGSEPSKIHFVTHSLGGIVVRQYLQTHSLPSGSRIVMLSPPNQGSELVDKMKNWWLYKKVNGPAGQQLGTDPQSLPNLLQPIEAEVGIITGRKSIEPWFSRMIPGEDDGKVGIVRARLTEMQDFLVVDYSHPFIMNADEVIAQVLVFLQQGKFQHIGTEKSVK